MLTTPEIVLVAALAALIVVAGVFGSKFAAQADKALEEREAQRADGPQAQPPRPAHNTKKPRRRR